MLKNRRCSLAFAVAWTCFGLLGCGGPSDQELFQKAESLYRDGRFQEAIPVLKEYLLRHPDHSGAHLYLGGCYQFSDQWSALAEGEIMTALHFFERDGKKSTIPRFPDAYFELRCYLDLTKVQYARLSFAMGADAPPEMLDSVLNDFKHSIAEAQRIAPDNEEVKAIAQTAEELVKIAEAAKDRRDSARYSQQAVEL